MWPFHHPGPRGPTPMRSLPPFFSSKPLVCGFVKKEKKILQTISFTGSNVRETTKVPYIGSWSTLWFIQRMTSIWMTLFFFLYLLSSIDSMDLIWSCYDIWRYTSHVICQSDGWSDKFIYFFISAQGHSSQCKRASQSENKNHSIKDGWILQIQSWLSPSRCEGTYSVLHRYCQPTALPQLSHFSIHQIYRQS